MTKYFEKINNYLKSNGVVEIIFLGILIVFTVYTRFYNLGYSDYIGDEHKAFIELSSGQSLGNFFMTQRKGPMQFIVSHIPYLITGNFRNELAQRIPFSLASLGAVIVFYFLIKKLTKNTYTAFLSAFFLTVNGFIVGFGRIAQYQNLNLLFSFLALYFYADLIGNKNDTNFLKSSLYGTLFWCLSILSHWDAIFIFPVVVIIFFKYLKNQKQESEDKKKLFVKNFILGCFVLLPFLVPYTYFQITNQENMSYFGRRIEIGHFLYERYNLLITLYNPFLTLHILIIFGILGALIYKKSYIFSAWFLFAYSCFELFVRKPGTHIYNFIIPVTVLVSIALASVFEKLPKLLKMVWVLLIVLTLSFLAYQTHYIFIDHHKEYPWEQKTLVDFRELEEKRYKKKRVRESERVYHSLTTKEYDIDQKLPLFGFPHKRYWNEINEFIDSQNKVRNEDLDYITNEVKTISEWYMDIGYGNERPFYLVGIKRPLSFVKDYSWPQIGKKEVVKKIKNEQSETVVKIYRAEIRD